MHSDYGIILRLPDTEERPPPDLASFEPEEVEQLVTAEVAGSALFAARFRECAARALLLPRRQPGKRSPLWQQRQRSAQLLAVASRYPQFPVVLETMRECLQDVFDVPGLVQIMRDLQARRVRFVEVETAAPSPFARSLLMGYVAEYMYEGDSPLAERRAQALALDTGLLAELLGQAELRELLDPRVLDQIEAELQRLTPGRRARTAEEVADLLRLLGPLGTRELADRCEPDGKHSHAQQWLDELAAARRAIPVRIGGQDQWSAIEDAGRLRDALGVPLPVGIPEAFLEPVRDPLGDLVSRYARTHGPFSAAAAADQLGLGVAVVSDTLHRLAAVGRAVEGAFRPGGSGTEWCDPEVLRRIRRASLAALRKEAEPVPATALGRFLPVWQSIRGQGLRGVDGVLRAVEQLAGAPIPASGLERLVLPARVVDYAPPLLDELCAAGEVVWSGQGALPGDDGWISLYPAELAPLLLPPPSEDSRSPRCTPRYWLHSATGEPCSSGRSPIESARWRTRHWQPRSGSRLVRATDQRHARPRADTGCERSAGTFGAATGSARQIFTLRATSVGRVPMPSRAGPPALAGRWSLCRSAMRIPPGEHTLSPRRCSTAMACSPEVPWWPNGRPAGSPRFTVCSRLSRRPGGRRRGYFVEGLGAAQFAMPGAVDRLRLLADSAKAEEPPPGASSRTGDDALVLAATDPANPYGAALPWPERPGEVASGHKPGRKAGALVVLVDGRLALYVERGGRTLLTWSDDHAVLQPAVDGLALAVRDGALGKLTVERADGEGILTSPLGRALEAAGFHATPRGLRLRG